MRWLTRRSVIGTGAVRLVVVRKPICDWRLAIGSRSIVHLCVTHEVADGVSCRCGIHDELRLTVRFRNSMGDRMRFGEKG
jgi:hypothetical protein